MTGITPRRVTGVVTRHEAYGFYVDFGEGSEGVVVITMVVDDPTAANPIFPPVGTSVESVLLGYTDIGDESRLSTRPMDLERFDG